MIPAKVFQEIRRFSLNLNTGKLEVPKIGELKQLPSDRSVEVESPNNTVLSCDSLPTRIEQNPAHKQITSEILLMVQKSY